MFLTLSLPILANLGNLRETWALCLIKLNLNKHVRCPAILILEISVLSQTSANLNHIYVYKIIANHYIHA